MTSGLKKLWIEALESGKYRQGQERLRTPKNTFCCLGVLCDLVDPEGWKNASSKGKSPYWVHRNNATSLSEKILKQSGLTYDQLDTLIEVNDAGKPNKFRNVIKYIRENL